MKTYPFDTRSTLLYKHGEIEKTPISQYIIKNPYGNNPRFINAKKIIKEGIVDKIDLKSLYDSLIEQLSTKEWEKDIIYYYGIEGRKTSLKVINRFIEELMSENKTKMSLFDDNDDLQGFLNDRGNLIKKELKNNAVQFNIISSVQNELNQVNKNLFDKSDLEVQYQTYEFHPTLQDGSLPNKYHLLTIFDEIVPNEKIPHVIAIDDNGKSIFKTYDNISGTSFQRMEHDVNLSDFYKTNSIVVTIFATPTRTYNIVYNVEDGLIKAKIPARYNKLVKSVLEKTFSYLKIGNAILTNVKTIFELKPKESKPFILRGYLFLDFMARDTDEEFYIYSKQFYMNESLVPYALKKNFTIKYKPSWSHGDHYSENDSLISCTLTVLNTKKSNDLNKISIKVTSRNIQLAKKFSETLTLCLSHYYEHTILYDETQSSPFISALNIYKDLIPENELESIEASEIKKSITDGRKKKAEITIDAEIFPETIEAARAVEIYDNISDIPEGIKYLPFPPGEYPEFYFASLSEEYPYPGVIKRGKDQLTKYEYYPYTFDTIQTKSGTATDYNAFYNNYVIAIKDKSKTIITKLIMLKYGRTGELPKQISTVLKMNQSSLMYRYGIPRSPNSIIHCLNIAQGKFIEENCENLAIKERLKIMNFIYKKDSLLHYPIIAQETYGLSNESIKSNFKDTNKYFNPRIYFRALEEYFDVNIFLFSGKTIMNKQDGWLEEPRTSYFYVNRPNINRKSVLIFINEGLASDNLEYPQCELIIENKQSTTGSIMEFSRKITSRCNDIIMRTSNIITWKYPEWRIYRNFYHNLISLNSGIIDRITSQYIDTYGKTRAITIDDSITIVIPPINPFNVISSDKILSSSSNQLIKLMGSNPVAVTTQKSKVTGLWFSKGDIKYAIYAKISDINYDKGDLEEDLPSPIMPFTTPNSRKNTGTIIERNQRQLDIILELLYWTINICQLNSSEDSKCSLDEFYKKYVTHVNEKFTPDYYDTSKTTQILPVVNNIKEAIKYIQTIMPNFSRNGKFVFHNESFMNGIRYRLSMYNKSISGKDIEIPEYISTFYNKIEAFKKFPNVVIFLNEQDRNLWIKNRSNERNRFQIRDIIDDSIESDMYPILHSDNDNIYIIQNTYVSDLKSALTVSYRWLDINEQRNIGPKLDIIEDVEEYPYIIYKIGTSGKLEIDESHAVTVKNGYFADKNFLTVLRYEGETRQVYAALCKIL